MTELAILQNSSAVMHLIVHDCLRKQLQCFIVQDQYWQCQSWTPICITMRCRKAASLFCCVADHFMI